jgi:hypothetical protein
MTDAGDVMQTTEPSKDYVPPRVLKMGDMHMGSGDCYPGSGPGTTTEPGTGDCQSDGKGASLWCSEDGNAAVQRCFYDGNSPS